MLKKLKIETHNPDETQKIGKILASYLQPGDCIPLIGEMGTGKTCFVQGVARGLGVPPSVTVNSPSFTLINHYEGTHELFHVDLYRLSDVSELDDIELNEIIQSEGISFIEWPDLILPSLSSVELKIVFQWEMEDENSRLIEFQASNTRFCQFLKEIETC